MSDLCRGNGTLSTLNTVEKVLLVVFAFVQMDFIGPNDFLLERFRMRFKTNAFFHSHPAIGSFKFVESLIVIDSFRMGGRVSRIATE